MLDNCNFSYNHYEKTLKEIKKTHKFTFYSDCSTRDIILRHDVDSSLIAALKMAKLENKLNIHSTFFIYFSSEYYNPFSIHSSAIIRNILTLKHKIGLHYNEEFFKQNNLDPSTTIKKEIDFLENHFHTQIESIAAHEASSFPPSLYIELPKGIVNAYSQEFVVQRKYLSDSAMHWRESCFCKNFKKFDHLQVLIHPMWWSQNNKNRKEIMKNFINGEYDVYTPLIKSDTQKHEDWAKTISTSDPRLKKTN